MPVGRYVALGALVVSLVSVGASRSATAGEPFFFGFSEDLPKEIGAGAVEPAGELGGSAFRLTTLWAPGRTAIPADEATRLDRAVAAAGSSHRIVLAVYGAAGTDAPQDAAARSAYCSYVGTLLARYPSIRDVVVWNEPNKRLFWNPQAGAPAAYEELLARCYDGLPSSVNVVGLALSSTGNDDAGSTSPGEFIRGVGAAYRASGRTGRILDTVAHHPYGLDAAERPWRKHIAAKPIGLGDWNKLMFNLFRAFDGTGQPLPGEEDVRLWYTEAGFQTSVDPGKTGYTGTETVPTVPDEAGGEPESPPPAETAPAPDQATQALDAIRLAACQPHVAAYFNFLLADEPRLEGWQSGVLWADRTRKDSWPAFRQAIAAATGGTVDCAALKGGRPSADFLPPATPQNVRGTGASDPLRVDLAWDQAADDASTVSYRVFRNGAHVATTAVPSWTTTAVTASTTYTFTVRALDAAGNLGDASAPVTVTTPPAASAPPAPPPAEPTPPPSGGGGGGALPPDLRVALATTPAAPRAGEPVDAVVTVANDSTAGTASAVFLSIVLPPGSVLLGAPVHERGQGCTGTTAISCALDFLPNGWSTPVRLRFLPGAGALSAVVSAPGEQNGADNGARLDVSAAPPAPAPSLPPVTRPPAPPAGLRGRVRNGRLTLVWSRSPDHRRVRTYLVFRDGVLRRQARLPLSYIERALRGRHVYTVRARATDGRRSDAARIVVRR